MKKLTALFASLLAVVSTVSLLFLTACKSDPETATQKDMLKHSVFVYESPDGDESHNWKLTMNKNNTYTLYIKDYDNSTSDNIVMITCTGTWSRVFTYEYEYSKPISAGAVFNSNKTAVLGIYSLEGCEQYNYFGYHKSWGEGELFFTKKTIDETYLNSCRSVTDGFPSGLGAVKFPNGINFKSEK